MRVVSLEPSCWRPLVQQVGNPFLPSLRKLALPVMPPYPEESLLHVSPSVRELALSFPNWRIPALARDIQPFLTDLLRRAPHLTCLKLESECYMHHDMEDERFVPWGSSVMSWAGYAYSEDGRSSRLFCQALASVAQLPNLETFHMGSMNVAVADVSLLRALATLPRLRDAAFAVDIVQDEIIAVKPGFRMLSSLLVSKVSHGDELQPFDSPNLHNLRIYHNGYPTLDACRRTLELIGQRFTRLRRLLWKAPFWEYTLNGAPSDFLTTTIQPLFALKALEHLTLDVGQAIVRDSDVEALASGLPHLVHLLLEYDNRRERPPTLTARALLTLAQGCPNLLSLQIGGIFVQEADDTSLDAYPFGGHGLQLLYVASLQCKEFSTCTMIVDRIFPNVDIVWCHKRCSSAMRWSNALWANVLDRLEMFQQDRKAC